MNETLQFPLPLLAYLGNFHDRLEAVITYATVATGMHRLKVLSPSQIEQELSHVKLPKRGDDITDEQIRIIALGCVYCNVSHPENTSQAKWRFKSYQAAENFLQSWKAAGRTAPWTRIPAKMAFEARDGTAKTYQRFAALCAVNAAIGSKPFAVVTRNRVRAGMLGYSSGKLLFDKPGNLIPEGRALLESREDQQHEVITTSQARTLLDNFVKTRLLNRFTPYRGSFTYYSKNRPDDPKNMTAEKIGEALLARARRTGQNPKLKQLGELIRQAKQGQPLLSGDGLEKSPHNTDSPLNRETATQSPADNHPIATQSPLNAALNAALNASINASLNAGSSYFNSEEKALEAKPEHHPDGGEPTLDEVKRFVENKVGADAGVFASMWLKTMKKRGWKDNEGQPLKDWKPFADKCCQ